MRDSQPKLSPTPKFPVDDKAWDQTKCSPTPKFSVTDKARGSQTKLSTTPKFPLADKAIVGQFGSWAKFGLRVPCWTYKYGQATGVEHVEKNARKSVFFSRKKMKITQQKYFFCIYLLVRLKYWGKQIFTHGSFPEVDQKQKTWKKRERKRAKVDNNNGPVLLLEFYR